jgi:uncharacterized membrane protein
MVTATFKSVKWIFSTPISSRFSTEMPSLQGISLAFFQRREASVFKGARLTSFELKPLDE